MKKEYESLGVKHWDRGLKRQMGNKITQEERNISFAEAYIEGDDMYAAGLDRNILLKYNLKNQTVERLGWFAGFRFPVSSQNAAIYRFGNSLFCFSLNSYEVAEYELQTRVFRYYSPDKYNEGPQTISTICHIKEWVWMFRDIHDKAVMVFSMKDREFQCRHIQTRNQSENALRHNFEYGACIDGQIWRCVPSTSNLLVLDTRTLETCTIQTDLQISFFMMNQVEKKLYIISMDGRKMVVFDTDSREVLVYETGYVGVTKYPFTGIAEINGRIFLIPFYEKKIFCYVKKGRSLCCIKKLDFPNEFKKVHEAENRNVFMRWKKTGNILWLLPFAGNGMLRLDASSLQVFYCPIRISEEDYFMDIVQSCSIVFEGQIKIGDYLKVIKKENEKENTKHLEDQYGETGRDVWEVIAERVFDRNCAVS